MTISAWTTFWACVIIGATGGFALLAIVVAIRGAADVRSMFRQIDRQHATESVTLQSESDV